MSLGVAESFRFKLARFRLFLRLCPQPVIFTVYLFAEIDKGSIFVRLAIEECASRILGERWIRPPRANRRSCRIVMDTLGNPEPAPILRSQKIWGRQKIFNHKLYFFSLIFAQSWRFLDDLQWLRIYVRFQPKSWLFYEFCGPGSLQVGLSLHDNRVGPLLNNFLLKLSVELFFIVF